MQFNSYIFTLCFMPLVTMLYFWANKRGKTAGKILLLAASVVFYTNFDFAAATVMAISLAINFLFAKAMERSDGVRLRKIAAAVPVIVNIMLLAAFKYTDFAIANINGFFGTEYALKQLVLPVGISFFTFQQIAYVVSVYQREIGAADLLDYLVYILYFPKILMGPLAEPADFIAQINDPTRKKVNWDNLVQGVQLFSFGLFKKMMLADVFANAVSWAFANEAAATSMDWILVMLFYTFQIYFDFSGYSDMALGSSRMLNIDLPINFDSPYKALSVRDFWKRWHISLTKFFTRYIYIPLGGSRKGKLLTCVNTFAVFLISGLWHGANWNFILWGAAYGLLMIADRLFEKQQEKLFVPVRWMASFSIVNVLWLLFRSGSISQWKGILRQILFFRSTNFSDELAKVFVLPECGFIENLLHIGGFAASVRGFWMFVFLLLALGICLVPENSCKNLQKVSAAFVLLAAVAFVWAVLCMGGESVFVYFNF